MNISGLASTVVFYILPVILGFWFFWRVARRFDGLVQNKKIFWLILTPSIFGLILYLFSHAYLHVGTGRLITNAGIAICGLFLALCMVPLLFKVSFVRWKNNDSSWWLPLILTLVAGFLGFYLVTGYNGLWAYYVLWISLLVSVASLLRNLIMAGKIHIKSTFFLVNLGFLLVPIVIACLSVLVFLRPW